MLDALKQALGMPPVYIPTGVDPGQVGALAATGAREGLRRLAPPM